MRLNTNAFRAIVVVLIIIFVGGLSFAGYRAYIINTDNPETVVEQEKNESEAKVEVEESAETQGTVITTGDSEFGTMLFDDKEQAIYIWEVEESAKAECYDDCAEAWPPVLTDAAPVANGDVKSDLLGTTERTDGTTQVTYNGHPLYYYAHEKPGEVKCHNVYTHGGLWWVIRPNGNRAD